MSVSQKEIDRAVYGAVPETCPHVDAAMETATELVKKQTGALRDALFDWVERALNAESELSDTQDRIKELESEVEDLKLQLEHYE